MLKTSFELLGRLHHRHWNIVPVVGLDLLVQECVWHMYMRLVFKPILNIVPILNLLIHHFSMVEFLCVGLLILAFICRISLMTVIMLFFMAMFVFMPLPFLLLFS